MARRAVTKRDLVGAPPIDTTSIPRDPDRVPDRLRYEAGAIYQTHVDGITLEELHQDPRFAVVALSTLQDWSRADGWVEARKQTLSRFKDAISKELSRALYSRVAQIRIQQMDTLGALKADLLANLPEAKVKSKEGAAKVIIDLLKYEADLAVSVGKELIPQGGAGAIEPRNNATDDEVLEAVRVVLTKRRKSLPPLVDEPEGGYRLLTETASGEDRGEDESRSASDVDEG